MERNDATDNSGYVCLAIAQRKLRSDMVQDTEGVPRPRLGNDMNAVVETLAFGLYTRNQLPQSPYGTGQYVYLLHHPRPEMFPRKSRSRIALLEAVEREQIKELSRQVMHATRANMIEDSKSKPMAKKRKSICDSESGDEADIDEGYPTSSTPYQGHRRKRSCLSFAFRALVLAPTNSDGEISSEQAEEEF